MPDASKRSRRPTWLLASFAAAVLIGALVTLVIWSERLPTEVEPIAWDREACAHCRMHIGERHFAGQIQLVDGRVLNFDDPGCLLRERANLVSSQIHATFFHHSSEDRWLRAEETGFVHRSPTPMGWSLGAVEASTPGAVSLEDAARSVQDNPHSRRLLDPAEGALTWR